MKKKKDPRPDRTRYKVTILLDDGTELVDVVYANNAAHAKGKAIKRVPEDRTVTTAVVEEEKP